MSEVIEAPTYPLAGFALDEQVQVQLDQCARRRSRWFLISLGIILCAFSITAISAWLDNATGTVMGASLIGVGFAVLSTVGVWPCRRLSCTGCSQPMSMIWHFIPGTGRAQYLACERCGHYAYTRIVTD